MRRFCGRWARPSRLWASTRTARLRRFRPNRKQPGPRRRRPDGSLEKQMGHGKASRTIAAVLDSQTTFCGRLQSFAGIGGGAGLCRTKPNVIWPSGQLRSIWFPDKFAFGSCFQITCRSPCHRARIMHLVSRQEKQESVHLRLRLFLASS